MDIKYVENSENLFIALSKLDPKQNQALLRIYQINLIGYVKLFNQIITENIDDILPKKGKISNMYLISCRLYENFNYQHFREAFQKFLQGYTLDSYFKWFCFFLSFVKNRLETLNKDDDYMPHYYDLTEERPFYDYTHLLFKKSYEQIHIVESLDLIIHNLKIKNAYKNCDNTSIS